MVRSLHATPTVASHHSPSHPLSDRDVSSCVSGQPAHVQWATVAEASDVAIVGWSLDGTIEYWNGGAELLYGYTADEAVGRSITMLIPECCADEYLGLRPRLAAGEQVRRFETRRRTRDGHLCDVRLHLAPIRDAEGNRIGVSEVACDITEERQAKSALRVSEARFAAASRVSPALFTITTVDDGRFIDVNDRFLALTGYTREEVIGRTATDLRLWVDPKVRERSVAALSERGSARDVAASIRTKGGEVRHVRFALEWTEVDGQPCLLGHGEDVTDRLRAEVALAASEARYRTLVEQVPAVIYTERCDRERTLAYISPYVETLLGYPPSAFTERTLWQQCVHPDDRVTVRAIAERTDATGEPYAAEYRMVTKDDRIVWVQDSAVLIRDDAGNPLCWQGIAYDVTDRRSAEAALQASEARFRGLVQHAADLISVIAADGTVLYVSPASERLFGFRPDDRVGVNGFGRIHAEDLPRVHQAMSSIATSPGAMTTFALRSQHRDGSWRWMESTATNLLDEPSIGGIVVNSRDITDQRVALEELRFRGELLDQAIVAVIAVDIAGNVTHWNRHAEDLYGWSRDETIGQRLRDILVGPSDREVGAQIRKRLEAGESWEGEFSCQRRDGSSVIVHVVNSPIRNEAGDLVGTVGISVDVSERKHLEARLAHLATHDALTGLPNRVLFADRLDHALRVASRRGEPVAVVMLDLDRFKLVNDDLGHAAGDQLLVAVGDRLSACIREVDTLSRFSGDEFVLLLEGATPERARTVAERILTRLAEPLLIAGREVVVSTSMGITFSAADRSDPSELLRAADVALYRAKRAGRSRYVIFDPSEPDATVGWLALEEDLRRAIRNHELSLSYQPVIDLTSHQTVGVEALVRWHHPTRGSVPPTTFVPLAEETGLITELTAWVIGEACQQLALWHSVLGPEAVPRVYVNLTSRDLRDPELVERITRILHDTGIPPRCLCLEITEHVLVEEVRAATRTLDRLRALGIGLAIDDFGAGASSLASLRSVNAEVLKLDRAFVRGMTESDDDRIVVAAIVAMAHALGIRVTAEGIETPEQRDLVRMAGCDQGQGFWFARPLPPTELLALLSRSDQLVQAAVS